MSCRFRALVVRHRHGKPPDLTKVISVIRETRKANNQNTEKWMLEKEIPKTATGYQNRIKDIWTLNKNRSNDLKKWRNRRTENPNAFLLTSWLIYPVCYPGCQRRFSRWGRQNWATKLQRRVAKRRDTDYSLAYQHYSLWRSSPLAAGERWDLCHPGYLSANSDYSSNKLRILGSCSHPPRCCLSK